MLKMEIGQISVMRSDLFNSTRPCDIHGFILLTIYTHHDLLRSSSALKQI